MKNREVVREVRGKRAVDGAGVRLVRVLGPRDTTDFDPFLMLDSFDSTDPADYVAGFPTHPHRGIETITYLISGEIEHQDSLGNKGVIRSGEAQWMTAGSGILHQEMPQASERMLGFQLWLNLPGAEKMADPAYLDITAGQIGYKRTEHTEIRVLSGRCGDVEGVAPRHIRATVCDVSLDPGAELSIPVDSAETVFVFLIEGDAVIGGRHIPEKTAALLGDGDTVLAAATGERAARFILCSGRPLREPIAWGGPIVMNTEAELNTAFEELSRGTFIKHS